MPLRPFHRLTRGEPTLPPFRRLTFAGGTPICTASFGSTPSSCWDLPAWCPLLPDFCISLLFRRLGGGLQGAEPAVRDHNNVCAKYRYRNIPEGEKRKWRKNGNCGLSCSHNSRTSCAPIRKMWASGAPKSQIQLFSPANG